MSIITRTRHIIAGGAIAAALTLAGVGAIAANAASAEQAATLVPVEGVDVSQIRAVPGVAVPLEGVRIDPSRLSGESTTSAK